MNELNETTTPTDQPASTLLDDWIVFPAMATGIVVTTFFPVLLGQRLLLPLLSGLVLVTMFFWAVRQGRPDRAILFALFWIGMQSLCVFTASLLFDVNTGRAISGGLEYRNAWLQWGEHGTLTHIAPSLAWGRQLVEDLAAVGATALTGGTAGLWLLVTALDRVSFTAASLVSEAQNPLLALLASWPLWLILRIVGVVVLSAALAEPVANLDLWPGYLPYWLQHRRRLLLIGLVLLVLGLLAQLLLAPLYQNLLRSALG
ncbi:MAG: hypothetical protein WAZ19_11305 [Anaerolineae bacterium]